MAAIATASKPRQLWPASHGQPAMATASQPRHLRPASKGHSQPAKAAAQPRPRAVGSKQPAVTFFFSKRHNNHCQNTEG